MRKCVRCENEMREGYGVKLGGEVYELEICKQGLIRDGLGKVRVAACPQCSYLEFYLEDGAKPN